jgi:hypothetical protein
MHLLAAKVEIAVLQPNLLRIIGFGRDRQRKLVRDRLDPA